jgi:hypothetical protein
LPRDGGFLGCFFQRLSAVSPNSKGRPSAFAAPAPAAGITVSICSYSCAL